jgi:outer membrane protein assembly factor BamB
MMNSIICLLFYHLFFSPLLAQDAEWRGWRGLEKQACSESFEGPDVWTSRYNILWKVDIDGEGHSSPVVSENCVFVTAASFDDSELNFNMISINVLLVSVILIILWNLFSLIKNLLINRNLSWRKFISELLIFSLYGFLIFIFCVMHWMYFDDHTQPVRTLIIYLFTGSVFFLCFLLLMTRFQKKSIFRIIGGILIIILAMLLVKFLPLQDYYTTSDFFQPWLMLLIIPAVMLPLLLAIFMIIKTIIIRYSFHLKPLPDLEFPHEKCYSSRFLILSAISAFVSGISGYLAIPIITIFKVFYKEKIIRIQEPLKFATFFNPEFAFPFFLGVLSLGFLFWFVSENKKNEYERKGQFYLYIALVCCSTLFFIISNLTIRNPECKREIVCIDRFSGVIKWRKNCITGPAEGISIYNSLATPTPLIQNNFVYAYFGSAGFVSADFKGNILWKNTSLPTECIHGAGSSPVVSRTGIIILNSTSKDPYLTSLDFKTGKQQWKNELKGYTGSLGEYRSPVLFDLNGQELIIEWSFLRNELVLYEAKTGKVKYKYKLTWDCEGESITTPIINKGIIYLSDRMHVVAIDIFKLIGGKSPIIWEAGLLKKGPETSSPVLGYEMLFMVSDNGFVTCLDSKTGGILWQEKLSGTYFSSPIVIGKKVYFSNTAGLTTVLECSNMFKRISENQLPEGIYSTLVPVDSTLLIRTKNTLWCIK